MANIFISYARGDARDLALRLRDSLAGAGHHPWLDLSEIEGGDTWTREIEDAIETCDLLIALLSPRAFESQYCRAEQLRAMRKGKRIIPLLAQADAERPIHLEHLNYIDFSAPTLYDSSFQALLLDIAGRSPRPTEIRTPIVRPRPHFVAHADEKPDAHAFQRHLEALRDAAWLGERYWFPYYLFYVTDIVQAAEILREGVIQAEHDDPDQSNTRGGRWKSYVHLDFRPRTPALYRREGLHPQDKAHGQIPMPVYFLFDIESILRRADTRFTAGDVFRLRTSYKRAADFKKLNFEQIYHDSWFKPEDREAIMTARQAAVLVPNRLDLTALSVIWCRTPAERETLRALLPTGVWPGLRDQITARDDFNLFFRHWAHIETVELESDCAYLRFQSGEEPTTYTLRAVLEDSAEETHEIRVEGFIPAAEFQLELPPHADGDYTLQVYLDDALAYLGKYKL